VTLFNAAAERIFGYTAQEVLGRNVNMLMPEPFRSRHDHYLKNYLQTGVKQIIGIGREVKGVRKDASLFPMSLSITELRVGNDKKFIGLVRDITESKLLNEKLLINQNMKQAILRSSLDGIITIDSQGLICEFSPSAEKMFGYDAKAIHGKPMYQLLIPDRFRELHLRGLAHYVKTGEHKILGQRIEIIALNSVGQEFPVELTVTPQFSDEGMFFTAFIRDISEAKRAQEALRQALKQAEQASLLKSQFLSTMSHEIRTPLNIILGAQELLFDMAVEDTQKYYLKLANDAGNTLFALINDILDLSKVEAGKLELENHVFDPLKLINEVLQLISIKAEEKKLALHCEIAPQVATIINGDSRRLRQVLLNLLTNAVKFTQVGEIILRLTPSQADPDKGVLLFEIIDTGIGIDEEIQKRLFQHFLQADPSDTRKYGGSGLGLAISRRLVELWGGKIGLESQVGKGCRFWFSFGQAVDNTQVDIAVESKELQQSVSRSISTVLLVEDSPANQAVLSGILRTAHHEVDVVDNGIAAIAAVQAKAYDLIFMDVSMPNMDGMEATRHIRALGGAAANVPIVAMTAHAIKGYQVRCLEAGMSDYATKPISKKHLLKLVERWNDTDIKNVTHAVEQSVPAIELDLFDDKVMHDLSVDTGIEDISLLIRIFVDELTKCQILLMEAIEKQALDELAHLAHTLKSSTGHFGARRLQSLAIEVNDHCQKGDLVMALHFARRLLPCLEVTLKDLKVRIV
jgi:PAS domain S-box-containing protein